jgi:hypothetical protein
MSSYFLFDEHEPNDPNVVLLKGARAHGQKILGNAGTAIMKGAEGAMPAWMTAAHERVAKGAAGRDLERIASQPSRFGKRAEEIAAHEDRANRENALSAAQHREIAREHHAREYAERAAGNFAGASAHDAAANAHHRAAELASSHDSEGPFASHRAREATRNANRCCRDQVNMPGHASKAAGGNPNFGSRQVRQPGFTEPSINPHTSQSGTVTGAPYESGYSYDPQEPASPMARLFGPPQNASEMNWPDLDPGAAEEAREAGRRYDPAGPPYESLTSLAERHMASGGPYSPLGRARR